MLPSLVAVLPLRLPLVSCFFRRRILRFSNLWIEKLFTIPCTRNGTQVVVKSLLSGNTYEALCAPSEGWSFLFRLRGSAPSSRQECSGMLSLPTSSTLTLPAHHFWPASASNWIEKTRGMSLMYAALNFNFEQFYARTSNSNRSDQPQRSGTRHFFPSWDRDNLHCHSERGSSRELKHTVH